MTPLHDIDVIVFDILGTMVDEPRGIKRGLRAVLPDVDDARISDLLDLWHRYVDEQQEVLAGRRPYASSTAIDLEAAARVAADADVKDPDAVGSLASSGQRLAPWPDTVSALDRIASRFPVVGLSNASHSALTRISAHAGLRWHQVLSAEDARSYKPHPDVYRLAITNAGCSPDRLLMVVAHAWDLRGAQAVGMRTAYVERPVGDPPSASDSFDLHAKSLDDLAAAHRALTRAALGSVRGDCARTSPARLGSMPLRLHHIVIDAHDLPSLAQFWADALGWTVLSAREREVVVGANARRTCRPLLHAGRIDAKDRQESRARGPDHDRR